MCHLHRLFVHDVTSSMKGYITHDVTRRERQTASQFHFVVRRGPGSRPTRPAEVLLLYVLFMSAQALEKFHVKMYMLYAESFSFRV